MLESVENFFAPITHDFVEPHIAVDSYEEGTFVDAGGLRVRSHLRVDEMIPNAHDLHFGAAAVHAQAGEHLRHDVSDVLRGELSCLLFRLDIDSPPLGEDAIFGLRPGRTSGRDESWIELQHDSRSLVQDEHAVRRQIEVAGDRLIGQKIVHWFEKRNPDGCMLVVEEKVYLAPL